jgi:hypothetical protein
MFGFPLKILHELPQRNELRYVKGSKSTHPVPVGDAGVTWQQAVNWHVGCI